MSPAELELSDPWLRRLAELDGLRALFVVDAERGQVAGFNRDGGFDHELDAVASEAVLRLAREAAAKGGAGQRFEGVVFDVAGQHHVVHAVPGSDVLYLYLATERRPGALGRLLHLLAGDAATAEASLPPRPRSR